MPLSLKSLYCKYTNTMTVYDTVYPNWNVGSLCLLNPQKISEKIEPLVWKMFESGDDVIGQNQSKLVIASTSFSQSTKTRN